MVHMSLPSTLVKALYLFIDLPDILESAAPDEARWARWERMSQAFEQLLTRISSRDITLKELVRTGDLLRLFELASGPCPRRNRRWRGASTRILAALFQAPVAEGVVRCLHRHHCVSLCLAAVRGERDTFEPGDVADVLSLAVNCIEAATRSSSAVSNLLLDDFRTCQGYVVLAELLLDVEEPWAASGADDALAAVVRCAERLVSCGFVDLPASLGRDDPQRQRADFKLPVPLQVAATARNVMAFHVLHRVFVDARTDGLRSHVLDAVLRVYTADPANYFIVEANHTLALFIDRMDSLSQGLRERVLKLLEYVVFRATQGPRPSHNPGPRPSHNAPPCRARGHRCCSPRVSPAAPPAANPSLRRTPAGTWCLR